MAKIKRTLSERSNIDRDLQISVTIEVDVNAEGLFTTTLKPEDAKIIESYLYY